MRRTLAILPLAVLFIANVVPSKAQKTAPEPPAVMMVVQEGQPLELACALRVEQRAEWRRDGGDLPKEMVSVAEKTDKTGVLTARLRAEVALPHLAGVYSCARGPTAQRLHVVVKSADAQPAPASDAVTSSTPAAVTTLKPIPDRAPIVDGSDVAPGNIQYYDIHRNISFTCPLSNPSNLAVVWEKNNTDVTKLTNDRYKLEEGGTNFVILRSKEDDYGNYSCKVGESALYWQVHARPYAKLPSTDTSVVEGQKLKLVCKIIGKPAVPVDWWYNKDHTSYDPEEKNLGIMLEPSDRITMKPSDVGVENGELEISEAARTDAGAYACVPRAGEDARSPHEPARTVLRVKDMYAALWPFLGICAEVLVLCAVILVYERRRTKPELDDSDTDNHDQKKS